MGTPYLIVVKMPYFGTLSENSYKIVGKDRSKPRGRRALPTMKTKPEVEQWMAVLTGKVVREVKVFKPAKIVPPVEVELFGRFKDLRSTPDLPNLHKVISDALEPGLEINDREVRFRDLGYDLGHSKPELEIRIQVEVVS